MAPKWHMGRRAVPDLHVADRQLARATQVEEVPHVVVAHGEMDRVRGERGRQQVGVARGDLLAG